MSKRELQRAGVLARVKAGELRLNHAAEVMRISYRQAKRLWKHYLNQQQQDATDYLAKKLESFENSSAADGCD